MIQKATLFACFALLAVGLSAQNYHYQYFDGADTVVGTSLFVTIDDDSSNVWQVGPPQKPLFDFAATAPNALMTDTIMPYPPSDTSVFYVDLNITGFSWGVSALEWMQQLDYETGVDGGTIEFWEPSAGEWQNCFFNPFVYNFYGYDAQNEGATAYGTSFTGTDSTWNSIWLCFDASYFSTYGDSIHVRFVHYADSSANSHEGWMIDNLFAHPTFIHTVAEKEQLSYIDVYPTLTTGNVHIRGKKKQEYHIIEHMEVYDLNGKLVKSFGLMPTITTIDLGDLPDGSYRLHITTNFETNAYPVVLKK